jgi:hypothetical protein
MTDVMWKENAPHPFPFAKRESIGEVFRSFHAISKRNLKTQKALAHAQRALELFGFIMLTHLSVCNLGDWWNYA